MVTVKSSDAKYRFGDGIETKAMKTVITPVAIGNIWYMMEIDVVKNDIPLLISRNSMKKMKMTLDFTADTANVRGKQIPLSCTTTGHYCIAMTNWDLDYSNVILRTQHLKELTKAEKKKKARKLISNLRMPQRINF